MDDFVRVAFMIEWHCVLRGRWPLIDKFLSWLADSLTVFPASVAKALFADFKIPLLCCCRTLATDRKSVV